MFKQYSQAYLDTLSPLLDNDAPLPITHKDWCTLTGRPFNHRTGMEYQDSINAWFDNLRHAQWLGYE